MHDKFKVFVIGCRGFPNVQGGIEKHSEEVYRRLATKYDLDITILTPIKTSSSFWEKIKFKYIFTINSKSLEKIIYGLFASIYSILKRPDIVHIQGLNTALYIPLLRLFGLKVIYTQHSIDYLYPKWGRLARIVFKVSEYCAKFSTEVFVVSPILKKHLSVKYQLQSQLIYNGIDFNQTENVYSVNDFDIINNKYLLFVGRITPEKDILTLMNAFNLLGEINLYLLIVGDCDHKDKYSTAVSELASKNSHIIISGYIPSKQLANIYQNTELFILASKYESLPLVVLEAIYFYADILLSDIPALIDFGFGNQQYFKVGDPIDLADNIRYLLMHKKSQAKLVQRRTEVILKYDWDIAVDKIFKSYNKAQY